MSKGMRINLVLISLGILFCCSLWNDKISFPENKKKYNVSGKVIDAKQVSDEQGRITNYLYQKVGNDIKKIVVTDNCYYNWRNKIGSNISFSYNTDEWNSTGGTCTVLTGFLCVWGFFSLLAFTGAFE
jgi:hypothetical protein